MNQPKACLDEKLATHEAEGTVVWLRLGEFRFVH